MPTNMPHRGRNIGLSLLCWTMLWCLGQCQPDRQVRERAGFFRGVFCPNGHVILVTDVWYIDTSGKNTCEQSATRENPDYFKQIQTKCNGRQTCEHGVVVGVGFNLRCPGSIFSDIVDAVRLEYKCQRGISRVRESFVASPLYGAVNATINMTLTHPGLNSTRALQVFIGPKVSTIVLERNATHLKVQIPKVSSRLAGAAYPIIIQYDTARSLETGLNFTFVKVDIAKVFPLRTITQGGISQTVMGRYLDTVPTPRMVITMVLRTPQAQQREVFYGECDVRDPTLMVCFTPAMNLSREVTEILLSRERIPTGRPEGTEGPTGATGLPTGATGGPTGATGGPIPSRRRRQATLANPFLRFYVGLDLQHDNGFGNLSDVSALRQNGTLNVVVASPIVYPFDDVIEYDPADRDVMNMKGENLDVNIGQSDYVIDIGQGHAETLRVTRSTLSHRPPKQEPAPRSGDKNGDLQVIVHIGRNIHFNVGRMRYKTFPMVTVIACLIAGVLLLAIIAMAACCVCRKRKRRRDAAPTNKEGRGNAAFVGNNMDNKVTLKDVKDIYPENTTQVRSKDKRARAANRR